MRKPTGDPNIRCLNMHHGVMISDKFMELIERSMTEKNFDDTWELVDPASGLVRETISAKYLWQQILELRLTTGEPYLLFIDTANDALPREQYNAGLRIRQSNICTEITLATDEKRTAVCCLSSLNLFYWDAFKDDLELLISDVAEMLDNVLIYFIENAPDTIERARYSAMRERAIGIGTLGFHSYLQSKMIPFESVAAKTFNNIVFRNIKKYADMSNYRLGKERGEAPDMIGSGKRFSHMIAVAPNATTGIILGNKSSSTEPLRANAFKQETMSGTFLNRNKELNALLITKNIDLDQVWSEIITNDGSVQTLKCLTDDEKDVFKTAMEIDQRWVIEHAADRQVYIDQAQSVNLFFKPDVNIKYIHAVHFLAWKKKLKTLYYCRSEKIKKADRISQKIERKRLDEIDLTKIVEGEECLACT